MFKGRLALVDHTEGLGVAEGFMDWDGIFVLEFSFISAFISDFI